MNFEPRIYFLQGKKVKKIKAYLQTFNDYELLLDSLNSIYGLVDELVVVDGCYAWLADYYSSIGLNPERSSDKVYDAIEQSKIPYKVISGVWQTQIEKRIAGFESCEADYVIRFDSDEILTIDEKSLDRFFESNKSVAGMTMPTYITPNIVVTSSDGSYPIQNFIFKKSEISARDHLEYMWLVLTADKIGGKFSEENIFSEPVAYNSHLTSWRSIKTSVNRATYYNTNWMRKNGFPFIKEFKGISFTSSDFERFFNYVGFSNYQNMLLTDRVSIGCSEILDGAILKKIETTNPKLEEIYKRYLDSYSISLPKKHNYIIFNDKELYFDLTKETALEKFFINGKMVGISDVTLIDVHAYIYYLKEDLSYEKIYLKVVTSGTNFEIFLPQDSKSILSLSLRTALSITFNFRDDENMHYVLLNHIE